MTAYIKDPISGRPTFTTRFSEQIELDKNNFQIGHFSLSYFDRNLKSWKQLIRVDHGDQLYRVCNTDVCKIYLQRLNHTDPNYQPEIEDEFFTTEQIILLALGGLFGLVGVIFMITKGSGRFMDFLYDRQLIKLEWEIPASRILMIRDAHEMASGNSFRRSTSRSTTRRGSRFNLIEGVKIPSRRFCELGVYNLKIEKSGQRKRILVGLLPLESKLLASRDSLQSIRRVIQIEGPNIAKFEGIFNSRSKSYRVIHYCNRGSLNHFLSSNYYANLELTLEVKLVLAIDILCGLAHLESVLGFHGAFSSKSCLLDACFRVKISNFDHLRPSKKTQRDIYKAPEVLRFYVSQKDTPNVLRRCDVYSFAIVFQEILYRRGPFYIGDEGFSEEQKIEQVRAVQSDIFRPTLEKPADLSNDQWLTIEEIALIEACWSEDAYKRPAWFRDILPHFQFSHSSRFGQKSKSIIDSFVGLLETYADNTERLVREKTKILLDERDRVDAISSMFLPRKEVAQIRNGTIPEPEYFPRASILNFDIVGYTVISKRSTPKEIFLMLETLFTLFDDTLHNFPNLFKVETLGDSYMISAGCPVKYDSHEIDLARFALQIRCKIHLNFRIQHLNMERLRMRIGIATGGVTSCIPNLNMPKFTVIGEAVQRALTLESECQTNRIHCDENTYNMLNQTNLFQFEESSSVSGPAFYGSFE